MIILQVQLVQPAQADILQTVQVVMQHVQQDVMLVHQMHLLLVQSVMRDIICMVPINVKIALQINIQRQEILQHPVQLVRADATHVRVLLQAVHHVNQDIQNQAQLVMHVIKVIT